MPEVSQIEFTHQELVTQLIKAAGLHEGKWMLLVNFNFSAGNFGASATEAFPGAIVAVSKIGLVRATEDAPDGLVVDASLVTSAP
jgi:hypothetical protein